MSAIEVRVGSLWQHESIETYIVLVLSKSVPNPVGWGWQHEVLWKDQKGFLDADTLALFYKELR